MALDYEAEKVKLRALIAKTTPSVDEDINQLV